MKFVNLLILLILSCSLSSKSPKYSSPFLKKDLIKIKNYFGKSTKNYSFHISKIKHKDVKFQLKKEAPIMAIQDGIVKVSCDTCSKVKGKLIEIEHLNGLYVKYYHLSNRKVEVGALIKKNDVIGLSGTTGYVGVNSLGVQTKVNNRIVNPLEIIKQ